MVLPIKTMHIVRVRVRRIIRVVGIVRKAR